MATFQRGPNRLFVLILLLVGAVMGTLLGEVLQESVPFLATVRTAGFSLDHVDLAGIADFHLGMSLRISLGTVLGILLMAVFVRRM